MTKTDKNTEKQLLLRLPLGLWEKVFKFSKKNNRSINGEIVQTLQEKTK